MTRPDPAALSGRRLLALAWLLAGGRPRRRLPAQAVNDLRETSLTGVYLARVIPAVCLLAVIATLCISTGHRAAAQSGLPVLLTVLFVHVLGFTWRRGRSTKRRILTRQQLLSGTGLPYATRTEEMEQWLNKAI